MKAISAKVSTSYIITSLFYGLAFIVKKMCKNKIYKLRKVDDRISVLQLTRSKVKSKKKGLYELKKGVLNQTQD